MLFSDKLATIQSVVNPEFDRLFDRAIENQQHPNDLVLIVINGFYTNQ